MGMNVKKNVKKKRAWQDWWSVWGWEKVEGQKGGYGTREFQSRVDWNWCENMLSDDSPSSGSEDAETPWIQPACVRVKRARRKEEKRERESVCVSECDWAGLGIKERVDTGHENWLAQLWIPSSISCLPSQASPLLFCNWSSPPIFLSMMVKSRGWLNLWFLWALSVNAGHIPEQLLPASCALARSLWKLLCILWFPPVFSCWSHDTWLLDCHHTQFCSAGRQYAVVSSVWIVPIYDSSSVDFSLSQIIPGDHKNVPECHLPSCWGENIFTVLRVSLSRYGPSRPPQILRLQVCAATLVCNFFFASSTGGRGPC